uniref:Uncharacterized protein n=1 Tax=Lepeophtheirus salmonis TaxID=72036 RepID=A0A0K2UHE8_LEPSM
MDLEVRKKRRGRLFLDGGSSIVALGIVVIGIIDIILLFTLIRYFMHIIHDCI